jgi:hypothetical protein
MLSADSLTKARYSLPLLVESSINKDNLTNPETLKCVRSHYSEGRCGDNRNWDNTIPLSLRASTALPSTSQPPVSEQSPLHGHAAHSGVHRLCGAQHPLQARQTQGLGATLKTPTRWFQY